jgi:hypothetical protein
MKFSIRDLLLVTVIVALAVGWGIERYRSPDRMLAHRAGVLKQTLIDQGWEVEHDGWHVKISKDGVVEREWGP